MDRQAHPLLVDEGVDLWHGDDLGHQTAEPLWIQEVEPAELALHIIVVEENPTLMEEDDGLGGGGGGGGVER